jgi:hypothetical protein
LFSYKSKLLLVLQALVYIGKHKDLGVYQLTVMIIVLNQQALSMVIQVCSVNQALIFVSLYFFNYRQIKSISLVDNLPAMVARN